MVLIVMTIFMHWHEHTYRDSNNDDSNNNNRGEEKEKKLKNEEEDVKKEEEISKPMTVQYVWKV